MKEERKKKMGKRYLSAEETLPERWKKKLVENTNWYKEKKKEKTPPEDDNEISGNKKIGSNYIHN